MKTELCKCGAWNTPTSRQCWRCGRTDETWVIALNLPGRPRAFDLYEALKTLHWEYRFRGVPEGGALGVLHEYHNHVALLLQLERIRVNEEGEG